jgi:hypothetical protein
VSGALRVQKIILDKHATCFLNSMEKTHTLIPTKRFIFFFMLRNKEMALLSQHLMLRNGRHRE